MSSSSLRPRPHGRRIVICDYNALLLSVTGLLRMAGYCVFQAHDGYAVEELCVELPDIALLILNTTGTGVNTEKLVQDVRSRVPELPVLHIGPAILPGLPRDVPNLDENFSPDELLRAVDALIDDRRPEIIRQRHVDGKVARG